MVWVGAHNKAGYGIFWNDQECILAHHHLGGKPPIGLVYDHVKEKGCNNRDCILLEHLELVTQVENIRRGRAGLFNKLKTHCPRGHEYSHENTRIDSKGRKSCRRCQYIRIMTARGKSLNSALV